jgi:hypothetical protein
MAEVLALRGSDDAGIALASVTSDGGTTADLWDGTMGHSGNLNERHRAPNRNNPKTVEYDTSGPQKGVKGLGLQLTGQVIVGGELHVALVRDANNDWAFIVGGAGRWGMDANVSLSLNGIYAPNAVASGMGGFYGETGLDLLVVSGAVSGPPLTVTGSVGVGVAAGHYVGIGYNFSWLNPFSYIVQ